jgi:aspartate kinase
MAIKVLKFGGTSVADSTAMRKVFDIISSNREDKQIVVLSACAGITDKLLKLSETALSQDNEYLQILEEIENHHLKLIVELFRDSEKSASCIKSVNFLLQSLKKLIEGVKILEEITPKVKAEILSYGELLSTNIFYQYALSRGLNSFLLDSREIIETDNYHLNAKPNFEKIQQNGEKLKKLLQNYPIVITQGFIGNWKKETTILGRGGSDLSASLFGYSVNADEILIWTDVDGIMTTDPRLVPNAKVIEKITVDEVAELSFFGAKVLHPDTIKPALAKNIPVKVLNTFNPNGIGTTIYQNNGNTFEPKVSSMLLIEDCFYLRRQVTKDSRDFSYYLNLLKSNFEKLFKFSFNDNTILAIVKSPKGSDSFNLLEQEEFLNQKVDAIALFGLNIPNIDKEEKSKLDFITDRISELLESKLFFVVSDYSAILLLQPNKGKEVIEFVHSILFD